MKKAIAICLSIGMVLTGVAYANEVSLLNEPIVEGSNVTLSGSLSESAKGKYSYYVANNQGEIVAIGEGTTDEDGSFTKVITLDGELPTDDYTVTLGAVKSTAGVSEDFRYVCEKDREELRKSEFLNELNTEIDYKNVKQMLDDSVDLTGISFSSYNNLGTTKKNEVLKGMLSQDFADCSAVKTRFDSLVKAQSKSTGSTGGKTSGRGGSGSSISVEQVVAAPVFTPLFTDLDTHQWARIAVNTLAEKNIVNNTEYFEPARSITRAEFTKLVVNAFALVDSKASASFSDVSEGEWYYIYAASAQKHGIVNGENESFYPNRTITRQEMTTIIYRALKTVRSFETQTGDGVSFGDEAEIADWALEAVEALSAEGIVNGTGSGDFEPKRNSSRAEAAQIIYNVLTRRAE